MSPYLVAEKKKCKQVFEQNLAAALKDPSKISEAVNARLAVQLDKKSKNDFTSETLGETLLALDQNTKKGQSALLPQNDEGQVITFDEGRVRSELKKAGYTEEEIDHMKPSDAIVYASIIAKVIVVSVTNIYQQYCDLLNGKEDDTELVVSVMSDQKKFETELYGGSRKVIDTVNKQITAGADPDENFFSKAQKHSAMSKSVSAPVPVVKKPSEAPAVNQKFVETQSALKEKIKQLDPSKKENTDPEKPWQYYVTGKR